MPIAAQAKNLYEVIVVLNPNLNDEELDKNISTLESTIKNYGGSIVKFEEPIKRRLTHKIKGMKDGFYVSCLFNSSGELPNLLKRTLSISDSVLRYILVRKESKQ